MRAQTPRLLGGPLNLVVKRPGGIAINWEAFGAIGEVVGATAVVVTLIYLALQIRQNTNATQGTTELDIGRQLADWTSRVTADPELQDIYNRASAGSTLSTEEAYRYVWLQCEYFFLCEGWYRQYKRGLIPKSSWDPLAKAAIAIIKTPPMTNWWNQVAAPLSDDFREHINALRSESAVSWNLPDVRAVVPSEERKGTT